MAQYHKNFLPSQSQPWVRQVQDKLTGIESAFRTSEVNNRSRDDQLLASYNRLDKAFIQLAAQQSTLEAQQITLTNTVNNLNTVTNNLTNTTNIANNAISRLETYSSRFVPSGQTVSFTTGQTSLLNFSTSQFVSLSGGGSRNLSVTAIISIELGVNSLGTSTQPHRIRVSSIASAGGSSGSSETFVGVRKFFTNTDIDGADSRVVVYGGGTLAPSASTSVFSSQNVGIGVTVALDTSQLNGSGYFGSVTLNGLLINIAGQ